MPREDEITVREAGWPLEQKLDRFGAPMAECPECGEWWSATTYIPARLTRERDDALARLAFVLETEAGPVDLEYAEAWTRRLHATERLAHEHETAWRAACVERDEARAECDRLRALLREMRPATCDGLHHAKRDRHESGVPCPILTRLDAALEGRDA